MSWQTEIYMMFVNDPMHHTANYDIDKLIDEIIENDLTDREGEILFARFAEHITLEEIGKELNVTRERVRQLEAKALKRIEKRIRRKLYESKFTNNVCTPRRNGA